jgi:hypothetical protein
MIASLAASPLDAGLARNIEIGIMKVVAMTKISGQFWRQI